MNNRNDYSGEHEVDKDKAEITDSKLVQDKDGDSTLSTMIINLGDWEDYYQDDLTNNTWFTIGTILGSF